MSANARSLSIGTSWHHISHSRHHPQSYEELAQSRTLFRTPQPAVLEMTAGEVQWKQPKTHLSKARRDFFPQAKPLGVDVDQELSPSLQEKVALVVELLRSFPQAASAVDQLPGLTIGRM